MVLCALLGAGLVSACSNPVIDDINPTDKRGEKVKLNASCPAILTQTRGVGSVGDINSSADNVWKRNELHIYSIFKGASDLSVPFQDVDQYVPTVLLGGKDTDYMGHVGYAPYNVSSGSIDMFGGNNKTTSYYPIVGTYHFVGFHIDDAKAEARLSDDNSSFIIDVDYDGSQDIMVASDTADYTTRTARAGKHPNLTFSHQLTRLSFYVVAGDSTAVMRDFKAPNDSVQQLIDSIKNEKPEFQSKQGVLIDGIKVNSQYHNGYLRINCDSATWHFNKKDQKDFVLNIPEKKGAEETKKAYKVADMLVTPELLYIADIDVVEYIDQSGDIIGGGNYFKRSYRNIKIAPPKDAIDFLPGYSYDIKVTVFALEKIEITSSLTGWQDGGTIEVSPDEDGEVVDNTDNSGTGGNSGTGSGENSGTDSGENSGTGSGGNSGSGSGENSGTENNGA